MPGPQLYVSCLLLAVAVRLAHADVCDTSCQEQQLEAVQALYSALGAAPVPVATAPVQTPIHCSWRGVTCCTSSSTLDLTQGFPSSLSVQCVLPLGIAAVLLPAASLTGTIPDETVWRPLASSLEYIDFSGNSLTGTMPVSLGLLSRLKILRLNENSLRGSIPQEITQNCTLMLNLVLNRNALTGSIPPLGAMQNLTQLFLSDNHLEGPIPADWSTSPLLSSVTLSNNMLTSTIPRPVPANLYSIYSANMLFLARNNMLTGSLPPDFNLLPIVIMDVGRNGLSGDLSALDGLQELNQLRADSNNFTGSIPALAFRRAEVVDISTNKLTGTIPPLHSSPLRIITLSDNRLVGTLPEIDATSPLGYLRVTNQANCTWAGTYNRLGQKLPSYLTFVPGSFQSASQPNMQCPSVTGDPLTHLALNRVTIDPSCFAFQNCICTGPHRLHFDAGGMAFCKYIPPPKWRIMVPLFTLGAVLIAIAGRYTANLAAHSGGQALYTLGPDKSAPPEEGQPLTLVMTDVEGSTELWESLNDVMMQAQALHDQILRRLLRKYHGYEVVTEGDSFIVAFHLPIDALAWCAAVQQALVAAAWPVKLQEHMSTRIRLQPNCGPEAGRQEHLPNGSLGDMPKLSEVHPADILFWGLNVRMSVATGVCEKKMVNATSKRAEFFGTVMNTVKALSDMPHGGQVIMDEKSFEGVKLSLADLYDMVPHGPNLGLLQQQCRDAGSSIDFSQQPSKSEALIRAMSKAGMEREHSLHGGLSSLITAESMELPEPTTYNLASRMKSRLRNTLNTSFGFLMGKADEDDDPVAAPNAREQSQLRRARSAQREHLSGHAKLDTVLVLDMGVHMLPKLKGAQLIVQLLVPGLEERARALPALPSIHHTAGYFDAPGAFACPLRKKCLAALPNVTMVFCTIDSLPAMKAANEAAAEVVLMLYRNEVRRLLQAFGAYECQESNGEYMLAFRSPLAAAHFCFEMQSVMMQQGKGWSPEVLALPTCGPQVTEEGLLIWYGPRIRMGMCEGTPTSIMPHQTSGRADYFGPLVNRAARYGNAAARGGQIMVPIAVANALVEEWTGQALPIDSGPVLMGPPDYAPVPVESPLPQFSPEGEPNSPHSSINSKTAQQWSSKIRNSTAGKAATRILHRASSKGQYTLRLPSELEPAGSTEIMLSPDERESRSCPEFQLTTMGAAEQRGQHNHEECSSPRRSLTTKEVMSIARLRSETGPVTSRESPSGQRLHDNLDLHELARHRQAGRRPGHRGSPPGSLIGSTRASSELDSREQLPLRYPRKHSGLSPYNGANSEIGSDFQEIYLQECGSCRFKGVAEVQTVISLSVGSLAHRTFPPSYPSNKATLLAPFKGLLAIVMLSAHS